MKFYSLKQQHICLVLTVSLLFFVLTVTFVQPVYGQATPTPDATAEGSNGETISVPAQVDVQPVALDDQIASRLTDILVATEWFINPQVTVRDGVVFLNGQTQRDEWREWASTLARNTQDVVAVVNRIEVLPRSLWDFTPAWTELRSLWRNLIQALPLVGFGLVALLVAWFATIWIQRGASHLLQYRFPSPLLVSVVSWFLAAPVLLLGIYLLLRIAGLTQLALTVLGGTGVAGLVIGIAFRDIAENFLASILISIRNPFRAGDRIDVAGFTGIVQRVTTRGTLLMTLDGNHVQIPNATLYKSTIINYTSSPTRRMDFRVGIGYDAPIPTAQAVIAGVLGEHPVVLDQPEPLVLVEELGASTVNLCAYFWFNGSQYEGLKLKSSLIRLVKRALEENRISMPDEAREVIFPQGVPLLSLPDATIPATNPTPQRQPAPVESPPDPLLTDAEGDLRNEDEQIQEQARQSRLPEGGEDLLEGQP
ncbi:MAG TPA: mechanosensitive ion channel family protein [Caldilineaceae bacterium]|nr:mechanosensitive ion channel family protein [Caldilineaceae bacterium]